MKLAGRTKSHHIMFEKMHITTFVCHLYSCLFILPQEFECTPVENHFTSHSAKFFSITQINKINESHKRFPHQHCELTVMKMNLIACTFYFKMVGAEFFGKTTDAKVGNQEVT